MAVLVTGFGNPRTGYPIINLDLVAELRPVRAAEGMAGPAYDCFMADGTRIGRISASVIPETGATVVANTTGISLVQFYETSEEVIGEEDNITHDFNPIVAWKIEDQIAEPVTVESICGIWCYAVPGTAGPRWIFPEDAAFETFLLARNYAAELISAGKHKATQAHD